MLESMNTIYDTILWLQSQATSRRFPIVQFSGDTDMVTNRWVSLTSVEHLEIVVTQATADEYHAIAKGDDGYLQIERRVNAALWRTDFKCSWLVGVEEASKPVQEISFQEFLKSYQPPRLLFRDIFAHESLAHEAARTTRLEFECSGGKVVVLQ